MTREIRLELLLGRPVRARNGRLVGRVEEVLVEPGGNGWSVREYHVGTAALLERLAAGALRILGGGRVHGYRVRWDQLDLEDPRAPRLTCTVDELTPLQTKKNARPRST